eukprot:SAG31_NODE_8383_length_1462_cov_1.988261_2_plen_57_part_00
MVLVGTRGAILIIDDVFAVSFGDLKIEVDYKELRGELRESRPERRIQESIALAENV